MFKPSRSLMSSATLALSLALSAGISTALAGGSHSGGHGDSANIEAWPWMASLHSVGACLHVIGARLQMVGSRPLRTVGRWFVHGSRR